MQRLHDALGNRDRIDQNGVLQPIHQGRNKIVQTFPHRRHSNHECLRVYQCHERSKQSGRAALPIHSTVVRPFVQL